jgi:ABC-2 type transport system permease protein
MIPAFFWQRLRRWRAVARVEVLHLTQDRPTLAIIIVVPALQILLFGYAVRFEPHQVGIAIAREHAEPDGPLVHAIAETGLFRLVADGLATGEAARMVTQHRVLVGVEFPSSAREPDAGAAVRTRAIIDGSDPETVRPAMLSLEAALLRHALADSPFGQRPSVEVDWLYNSEGNTTWATAPALSGVIVMITMLLLGALTLAREREGGTWEGLLATPVSGIDAMVGKLTPYLLLGTTQAAVVLAVAHALFDLPLRGELPTFLWAAALLALAHLVLGFALSAVAKSQIQAIQGAVIFYLPSMLLSGFLFPFSGMPGWARAAGEALPLTHFVRVARGVLLRGDSNFTVVTEMWPVAVFTLVAAGFATYAYRRSLS